MKKFLCIIVLTFAVQTMDCTPNTLNLIPEAEAGVFDLKTDDSTTGRGLFRTKSYNERHSNWQRGY